MTRREFFRRLSLLMFVSLFIPFKKEEREEIHLGRDLSG